MKKKQEDPLDKLMKLTRAMKRENVTVAPKGPARPANQSNANRTPKPRSKSGLRPFAAARLPIQAAVTVMTSCVTMMHADINGAAVFTLFCDSISPSSGSIAAFAK